MLFVVIHVDGRLGIGEHQGRFAIAYGYVQVNRIAIVSQAGEVAAVVTNKAAQGRARHQHLVAYQLKQLAHLGNIALAVFRAFKTTFRLGAGVRKEPYRR